MKNNFIIKVLINLFKRCNFDRITILGLIIKIFNIILYDIYKGIFDFTIISVSLIIIGILMKSISKSREIGIVIHSIYIILLSVALSTLIAMILFHPNYTWRQARGIVVEEFQTKIGGTIKSEEVFRVKKSESSSLFIRGDYEIKLVHEDKYYDYIFDSITGKISVNIYSTVPNIISVD